MKIFNKKIIVSLGIIFMGFLVLMGCGNTNEKNTTSETANTKNSKIKPVATVENDLDENNSPAPTPAEPQEEINGEESVSPEGYPVSPKEAVEVFMEQFPNSQLTKIKLDHSDHGYVYKIEGVTQGEEHEVKVHALTKELVKVETEADDENKSGEVFEYNDKVIDWKEGMKNALEKIGATAYVKEWELSMENGKLVYEFDVKNDDNSIDVVVDAFTGEVLELDD
ncbi:MAG: PepSY domain-containing protein [Tissierellia bacterium]|nr:PepSY domain-containing protein [Tissierellia bacterium]